MKISVIITIYNVEKFIARCLQSVFAQSFKDYEVIIVNDATPDSSMSIVKKCVRGHDNVTIVNNEYNRGLMMARKVGYSIAKGDYITFLDSDDWLPSSALEDLYVAMCNNNADIVGGQFAYTDGAKVFGESNNSLLYGYDSHSVFKSLLKQEYSHQVWGKLYKKSVFTDCDYETLENFTNSEDLMLFYQIIDKIKKVVQINKVVYYYFANQDSSTRTSYNTSKVNTMLVARKKQWEIVNKDPELKTLAFTLITTQLSDLCYLGFRGEIKRYLARNKMSYFINFIDYKKYFSFKDSLILLLKQHGHFIYRIKRLFD